jgi:hypothetical protein
LLGINILEVFLGPIFFTYADEHFDLPTGAIFQNESLGEESLNIVENPLY